MDNVCFNVLSLNVRGIRDLHKRKLIFTWVRNQKADIIFLQETYSKPDVFQSWKFQWPGDMYFSHGSNHSKGVLLLIRETLQFELKSVRKDSHGRFIIVEALVQDSPVLLINVYAPNITNDAIDFYENLKTTLLDSDYDQAPVVQTVDNAIHRINHYPLDIAIGFAITYPVDSDLSGG